MNPDIESEVFLDYLSEHSSCSLDSDDSDESDINIRRRFPNIPPQYTDSESDDDSDESDIDIRRRLPNISPQYTDSESDDNTNIDITNNIWKATDRPTILEPFEGSSGIKIMPKCKEHIADVVNLFIGEDFFEHMVKESNRYHYQLQDKYKTSVKTKKWTDITVQEMKKFCGLIVLMGQVRKEQLIEYWSTDPTIETPIFRKVMARNRFMQILQAWHFCNNNNITATSDRFVKVQPIIDYFKRKFNDVYMPTQQLSLDECIIPWHGSLSFKTYNRTKIIKYDILVQYISEAITGYICNFEIYTAARKKLEETILSVTMPYTNMWYHIYLNNNYNSVRLAQTLIKKKIRICGTIGPNRGVPKSLQSIKLNKYETTFVRNQNILLQVWNNGTRNVNMITTIHSARLIDTTHKRTNQIIQKPKSIVDYNKFMKGVNLVDQYFAYYSIFRKTKKWTKKVVMFFINCALFNSFQIYVKLNDKKKSYKKFLHEIAIEWITDYESVQQVVLVEESDQPSTSNLAKGTSKIDNPGRLSNFKLHKLIKIESDGKTKRPQRQCRVCTSKNIRSRTCFICKYCNVPLHKGDCTERYHTLLKY